MVSSPPAISSLLDANAVQQSTVTADHFTCILILNNFLTYIHILCYVFFMTYSVDLRSRVVAFVRGGGSKAEAARRKYDVSRVAVYDWLKRDDLSPQQRGIPRKRKMDRAALAADVACHPDHLLKERAARFNMHISSIAYQLQQLKLPRKKND
jgi:transposase